jgi:hypothetical protein
MSFKVQIVNIENNVNNILLTDDLTIEILKVKYNWILNASIKNVVLGLDDYGLVWYSGEWICGEWEDGTWYSGIWHNGIWKNGKWYSYLLDKAMILSRRFVIVEEDKIYSQFLNGKWYNGDWYNGIFGNDIDVSSYSGITIPTECPYWINGNFYNGLFKNSVWLNGNFYNEFFKNSYWLSGKFYNGKFDNFEWHNGNFYGGDFVKGVWKNGSFNQININILSRFGVQSGVTSDGVLTTWENGVFENGMFMSGLNVDVSGNTIASICHNTTHWLNGKFNNGFWYGGHFKKGTFNYGKWYGGVFNTDFEYHHTQETTWVNGYWYDGLWMNGTFKSGMFMSGMWLNGIFENGFLVSEYTDVITPDLKENIIPQQLPTPPTPPTYYSPTVTTNSIGTPAYNSCDVICEVTNTGGLSTTRGICYSTNNTPTLNNTVIYDNNNGLGVYTNTMIGLSQNTTYYVRAFAINSLGVNYGTIKNLITAALPVPTVETYQAITLNNNATVSGYLSDNGGSAITAIGFIYSTTNPPNNGIVHNIGTANAPWNFGCTLTLLYGTTYYYVAFADNSSGRGTGSVKTFTTTSYAP